MLKIKKTTEGGTVSLALEGRLDTVTAPELEQNIKGMLDGLNALTLDFSKLEYISSAGLRVLLSTQKALAAKGGMKIKNIGSTVKEVFELTGFADILTIE